MFINIVTSAFLVITVFTACSVTSPQAKKVICTKDNINECKQEDKLYSVQNSPELIRYINKPNQEVQLAAVSKDAKLIRFIQKPNKEVQITALKQDPSVIEFIKNPSKEALRY
ncbi:hypothetical protein SMGD1_2803 [Sulfurimonas gotlandica GD1]|uniref:Uncharacterized protein n=2 Tax=Sulfurimonas TaxID=202746 RepID=H1FU19_SULGG|nr:hypothetical protein SMGD1_2803 [Sulfurimonas gotlandica GD1]